MNQPEVSVVIEGPSDEGVVFSILRESGLVPGRFHGRNGKPAIRKKIDNYNRAGRFGPWFVVVDLDNKTDCPAEIRREWVPSPERYFVFRVAVVEMESWLLADVEKVARFLGVSRSVLPRNPDDLADAKDTLMRLAARSNKRAIREGLVPRLGSGASVGPTYVSDLREFGLNEWRPAVAAENSPSLQRCLDALKRLKEDLKQEF